MVHGRRQDGTGEGGRQDNAGGCGKVSIRGQRGYCVWEGGISCGRWALHAGRQHCVRGSTACPKKAEGQNGGLCMLAMLAMKQTASKTIPWGKQHGETAWGKQHGGNSSSGSGDKGSGGGLDTQENGWCKQNIKREDGKRERMHVRMYGCWRDRQGLQRDRQGLQRNEAGTEWENKR
eukprot:365399-Chlamydomonas_euryale.AAC.11